MKKALFLLFTFGTLTLASNDTLLVAQITQIAIEQGKRVEVSKTETDEVVIKLKDLNDLNLEALESEFSQYTCAVF